MAKRRSPLLIKQEQANIRARKLAQREPEPLSSFKAPRITYGERWRLRNLMAQRLFVAHEGATPLALPDLAGTGRYYVKGKPVVFVPDRLNYKPRRMY